MLERLKSALLFAGVCVGSLFDIMKGCREGWMSVEVRVGSLDSFICLEEAGRSRVARRVSMELRSDYLGPG